MQGIIIGTIGVIFFVMSFFDKSHFLQFGFLGCLLIFAPVYVWLFSRRVVPLLGDLKTQTAHIQKMFDQHYRKMDEYIREIIKNEKRPD